MAKKNNGRLIEDRPIGDLVPYARNARTHSDHQVAEILASMIEFGFTNPVLADSKGIAAGHGRVLAAARADAEGIQLCYPDGTPIAQGHVPTINCEGWSDAQRRAYIIADNKIALNSSWDEGLLAEELSALRDDGFDLSLTGFSDDELADMLPDIDEPVATAPTVTDPDAVPEAPVDPVSRRGDVWKLGNHRLICGDSTSGDDLASVLAGEQAALLWTDPPYNVNYEGSAGKILNDHMTDDDFSKFLRAVFANAFAHLVPGAPAYIAHADAGPVGVTFRREFMGAGFYMASCLVWRKNTFVLGRSDYHWQHEPILYGWKPGAAHRWYGDRNKTTVLEQGGSMITRTGENEVQVNLGETGILIRGQGLTVEAISGSVFLEEKPKRNGEHPTMKPVGLVRRMVENSSERGDIVLDLFGGSGSTLIACEQAGRKARLVELDPKFTDVICRRWEQFTGRQARLEGDGMTFAEAAARRGSRGTGVQPAPVPAARPGLMVAGRPYTETPAANDERLLGMTA